MRRGKKKVACFARQQDLDKMTLFGKAFRLEDTGIYYAVLWEKVEGNVLHVKVAITFRSNVWIRVSVYCDLLR